jgi:DNA topoisomerase I
LAKNLVIVESPTKSKTLAKFLGRDFAIKATVGHVMDLPKSKLGIDIENGFQPDYVVIKGKAALLKELKDAAKKAKTVYLAPDPDREGEAIAQHIAGKLNGCGAVIRRATFNEITKKAVLAGIADARDIDQNLVDAQQARRILDRIVGYKVSPVLWRTVYRGLSAGRVQSVALRIICEREAEIDAFVAEEYWKFLGQFETTGKESFQARLFKIDGEDFKVATGADAENLKTDLLAQKYAVSSVQTERRTRRPLPPYITSTLQQDASIRLGFSSSKTMQVAQSLYEGVEIASEGQIGLITYMRTDSVRIAAEAATAARTYIENIYGKEYYPDPPNFYKTKKAAQDAHEAIRPTYLDYPPEKIKKSLTRDQFRLYELIWNRFLASQMAPAEFDQLSIDITGGKYQFRATSQKVVFEGFLAVYTFAPEENGNGNGNGEVATLPKLAKDDKLRLDDVTSSQHFTKPPPRFSEASLVKELEANGIGRPSTYAQIVTTLKTRKYVELQSRRLLPTDLGKTVNQLLVQEFPDIFSVQFTAQMEDELDRVEEGEITWQGALTDFYGPFSIRLKSVEVNQKELKESTQKVSDIVCEKCGKQMVEKWGRNGRFLACSGYPECKSTQPLEGKEDQPTDQKCELCGSPMVVKQGRFGKFMACSAYPECKNTKSLTIGLKCPKADCGGDVVEKRTRGAKIFWGCSKYPKCDFASWYKPVAEKCPNCGSNYMVEKDTKREGAHFYCPECKHKVHKQTEPAHLPGV